VTQHDDDAGQPSEQDRARRLNTVHLDRARRLHANHRRAGRSCGLCLAAWPCPAWTWADGLLRAPALALDVVR
jgi:hypothetical protein